MSNHFGCRKFDFGIGNGVEAFHKSEIENPKSEIEIPKSEIILLIFTAEHGHPQ